VRKNLASGPDLTLKHLLFSPTMAGGFLVIEDNDPVRH